MFKRKKIKLGELLFKAADKEVAFKTRPKKKLDNWVECPGLDIKKPKSVSQINEKEDIKHNVFIYSTEYGKARELLNKMIAVANKGFIVDGMKIWLHATRFHFGRVKGQRLHSCVLTYIFRIKAIPEEENL